MDNKFDYMSLFIRFLQCHFGCLAWPAIIWACPFIYAAVFAFGVRLFNNLAIIRRQFIDEYRKNAKDKQSV